METNQPYLHNRAGDNSVLKYCERKILQRTMGRSVAKEVFAVQQESVHGTVAWRAVWSAAVVG
jgi:hypothetical protein